MRLKLVIAYDGAGFQGWQIQAKEQAPPTIQGAIEGALERLGARGARLHGAGRTDSGVSALGQTAHLDLPDSPSFLERDWRKCLNALLPASVRILSAELAPPDFHARKSALAKTYIYDYWTEPAFTPPELAGRAWACGRLDAGAMLACGKRLLGEHDFSSFQNAGTPVESAIRKIFAIDLAELPPCGFYPPHAPWLRLSVSANGFLKQMARNIAGLLRDVGRGRIAPEAVDGILAARRRTALAAPTAPACGLRLARVYYAKEEAPFEIS